MCCGPERIRTADLLIANEALYQLSYGPKRGAARKLVFMPSKCRACKRLLTGPNETDNESVSHCRRERARKLCLRALSTAENYNTFLDRNTGGRVEFGVTL